MAPTPRTQVRLQCPQDGDFVVPAGEIALARDEENGAVVALTACIDCAKVMRLSIGEDTTRRLQAGGAQDMTVAGSGPRLVTWLEMVAELSGMRRALDAPDAAARFVA